MSDQKPKVDSLSPAATVSQNNPSIDTSLTGSPGGNVAAEIPVPKNFGRYKIEKELGKGAMGVVYLAEDSQIGRKVALKIPRKSAIEDAEALERFYREARTAGTLRHNNICPVYDVGAIDGVHYLTMAYIPGKPVSSFVNKDKFPAAKQVALLIRKIALALAEAHKQGVVHRDLKPSNVMLDDRNEPVVMDFGLARNSNTVESARLTQSGAILGTPAYMAPEQVRGDAEEIGPRSDVYALGVMMYQFLTGELPFSGPILMVFAKILTEQPLKPSELRPDVDRALEAICLKMMAKDASRRYAGMNDVATALTEYLKTGSVAGLETAAVAAASPTVSAPAKKDAAGHTEEQIRDLVELVEQLLLRNDYLEAIRLVGEIPDHERTAGLRRVLGDAYEMKSTVEKLERNLEKHLNQLDLPELKKTVNALLKIHPSHPRGKEIKKALNTGGKKEVALLRKNATHFDAAGSVWEPKVIAGALGGIAALSVMVYFAVTIYLKNAKITVNNPNAVVKVKDNTVTVDDVEVQVEGDEKPGDDAAGPRLAVAPFTADEAKAHQEAWAKHLGVPVEWENSIGMKFVLIPPGEFLMGAADEELNVSLDLNSEAGKSHRELIDSTSPRRRVAITQPFYLAANELTQAQARQLDPNLKSYFSRDGLFKDRIKDEDDALPADGINWYSSVNLCNALSEREKLTGYYNTQQQEWTVVREATGYRLPTEAEWEFACRAGTQSEFATGSGKDSLSAAGWFAENSENRTRLVGQKPSNGFGLFDMHGNMYEWCQDVWNRALYQQPHEGTIRDPVCTEGDPKKRVIRSGCWHEPFFLCRSAARVGIGAIDAGPSVGMRMSVSVAAVKQSLAAQLAAPPAAVAPFNADAAKAHQQAWAKHLGVPVEYTNSIGMNFVLIPPGEFLMGSTEAELAEVLRLAGGDQRQAANHRSEAPQHKVILTQPFYLGMHEVTQAEYLKVVGKNPSYFAPEGKDRAAIAGKDTSRFPVEGTNWFDAAEFCVKLSQQEQRAAKYRRTGDAMEYLDGNGYRLPREAEWEFACRAGTTTRYVTGEADATLSLSAWIASNGAMPHQVGLLAANPFGLHDIHGNVWEWVQDGWEEGYYEQFQNQAARDPLGSMAASPLRASRGGAAIHATIASRSACRNVLDAAESKGSIGFRVMLPVEAVKESLTAAPKLDRPSPAVAPFNADEAKVHQQTWAKYLGVPVEHTDALGTKFVLIPPGEFVMGSPANSIKENLKRTGKDKHWQATLRSEGPQHKVVLTKPFYLATTEVTQGQYQKIAGKNPSQFASSQDAARLPVDSVSWNEAAEFCATLNRQNPALGPAYRLPTEAEWEFAGRAGTTTKFWSGDSEADLSSNAWIESTSSGRPHPVGESNANPFGLHDIHGNVFEWVQDGWEESYYAKFRKSPAVDPLGPPPSEMKVLRGGDWNDAAFGCCASSREAKPPDDRLDTFGFRLCLEVGAVKAGTANAKVEARK